MIEAAAGAGSEGAARLAWAAPGRSEARSGDGGKGLATAVEISEGAIGAFTEPIAAESSLGSSVQPPDDKATLTFIFIIIAARAPSLATGSQSLRRTDSVLRELTSDIF